MSLPDFDQTVPFRVYMRTRPLDPMWPGSPTARVSPSSLKATELPVLSQSSTPSMSTDFDQSVTFHLYTRTLPLYECPQHAPIARVSPSPLKATELPKYVYSSTPYMSSPKIGYPASSYMSSGSSTSSYISSSSIPSPSSNSSIEPSPSASQSFSFLMPSPSISSEVEGSSAP